MVKWNKVLQQFKSVGRGISMLAFPPVCVCCGLETTEKGQQLCSFCKQERFEPAYMGDALNSSGVILPECVTAQFALWKFDQGGTLQELLHQLKYEHLAGIGVELGKKLGEHMKKHPELSEKLSDVESIMVPVPLHYLKFRKRGFNQAFMIARGMREIWDVPICGIKTVVRRKNTRSQTGFSLSKRIENMKEAFQVKTPQVFQDKVAIIVDDVFTTGSTSFELARTLRKAECRGVIIATVAQA